MGKSQNSETMKKTLFFLFFTQSLIAQVSTLPNSIGIGTGINSSIPLHINKNGELARFQGTSPYISLFDGLNMNGYLQAISSTFEIGSKNYYDLNLYTGDSPRLNINGTTGMVTINQKLIAQNGFKLSGPLQVEGESVGANGMVLVSNGNATPAWEGMKVGFQAKISSTTATTIPYYTAGNVILNNLIEIVDDGNAFNPSTGEFTCPSTGMYHFFLNLSLSSNNTSSEGIPLTILFRLLKNDVDTDLRTHYTATIPAYKRSLENNFSIKLTQGDVVKIQMYQVNSSGSAISFLGSSGEINLTGYKIY